MTTRRAVLAVTTAVATAGAGATVTASAGTTRSADPPRWVRSARAVCPKIDLTKGGNVSGQSGPLASGYNVYSLVVVAKRGVSCTRARNLARGDWLEGHHGPLSWRLRRSWRSTVGSGFVGDYRGTASGVVVEYHAGH